MKFRQLIAAAVFVSMILMPVSVPVTWADEDPNTKLLDLVTKLQEQIGQLQKTVNQQSDKIRNLEGRQPQVQMAAPASSGETAGAAPMTDYEFKERLGGALGGADKWLKDLKFSADYRLRYEAFQNTNGTTSETDDRNRFRYRLRFGFEKPFGDEMKVGFSLASGENSNGVNVDPTSTNTSFDNLFNFKDIWVEKAFASYMPNWAKIGPVEKLEITGGKFNNPFEKGSSDIIWDRDVKPEGIYEKINVNLLDGSNVDLSSYLTLGQFILDEDATSGGDAELLAHQLGLNAVIYMPLFERPVDFHSAVSYYDYLNYANKSNFMIGSSSLARGNPNNVGEVSGLDAGKFRVIESYNEVAVYPFGTPLRFYFDWAHNIENNMNDANAAATGAIGVGEDNAYALGTRIGGINKKGDWELSYAYKRLEANAVVNAFNDSDFGYSGHGAKRGSVFKAGYALTDKLTFNTAAFFVNNLNPGTRGILDEEQRRFQVDLVWKF